MDIINILGVIFEVLILLVGLALAINKKKLYGWLIALGYAICMIYDVGYLVRLDVSPVVMQWVLLIGVLPILAAVWMMYKEN